MSVDRLTVDEVHRLLRRGDFGDNMLGQVKRHAAKWQSAEDVGLRLKATYVVAEVLDYFGEYTESTAHLAVSGPEQHKLVRQVYEQQRHLETDPSVFKRRIWVTLAYATDLYRRERYEDALRVLNDCVGAVNTVDPEIQTLFGTRARLEHLRGQVFRQQHLYTYARAAFEEATIYARRRFVAKTPYVELNSLKASIPLAAANIERFDNDRLLAQWTIGRCLALGMGWIAFTTGQLSSASTFLNAGYTLLRGTGDGVHRAYALLLIGAVQRARAGDDQVLLRNAASLLEDAAKGLSGHPAFALRASYELALAYYKNPDLRDQASREVNALRRGLGGTEMRSARWMSAALVVESRIKRLDRNFKEALRIANEAVRFADKTGQAEIRAEALIALGEIFLEMAQHTETHAPGEVIRRLDHAVDRLSLALSLGGDNPKVAAVCHLHLARAYCRCGSLFEAHREREAARTLLPMVEHGFVKTLWKDVGAELEQQDCFFIDRRTAGLKKAGHVESLEAWLLCQANIRGGPSMSAWAQLLGVPMGSLKRMRARLLAKYRVPKPNPPGRPRKNRELPSNAKK